MDFDALTRTNRKALQAALAKAPATIRPLLKRDQAWFNEIMLSAAESMTQVDDDFREALWRRCASAPRRSKASRKDFGRTGVAGRWVNTFGSVTVTPTDGGYRLAIDTSAIYGTGSDRRGNARRPPR